MAMIIRFDPPYPTSEKLQEMIQWAKQVANNDYSYSTGRIFWFKNPKHGTLFLLTFGGKPRGL